MASDQFRRGILNPFLLSHFISELALRRSTSPAVKEFARRELEEATTILLALRRLGEPLERMDAYSMAVVDKLARAARPLFDQDYLDLQVTIHALLQDVIESYLRTAPRRASRTEVHTRHLATQALPTIKEHQIILSTLNQ